MSGVVKSGIQKEVFALYRSLLRESIKKDRISTTEATSPPIPMLLSTGSSSVTSHVSKEFRKQASRVDRKDFRAIEYKVRHGYKQVKLLQMPGVKTFKSFVALAMLLLILKAEFVRAAQPVSVKAALDRAQDFGLEYGVDVSFPMQHANVTKDNPLGEKQIFYENYISGCVKHYGDKGNRCLDNEKQRLSMNLRQPQGMYNYTKLGYTKIRAPENAFKLIKAFWEANKDKATIERWAQGNIFVNHWESPTYMANIENKDLEGGGYVLKQLIWNAARDTISAWTGQQLAECSLYGVRIYKEGAVLSPHVDRLPLVSSAIINVDQDVDEPWPLEVIGHDGKATNVTMVPGDLVLYESHSILHGRPFPLKGRFMANIFIHFEPIGPIGEEIHIDEDLPQYIIRGSEEEAFWRKQHPNGYKILDSPFIKEKTTSAHQAAVQNRPDLLAMLLEDNPELVNAKDVNGWTPLHEAVRGRDLEAVKVLLNHGADVNARTSMRDSGDMVGSSVLHLALKHMDADHEIVQMLLSLGAKSFAPGMKRHDEL